MTAARVLELLRDTVATVGRALWTVVRKVFTTLRNIWRWWWQTFVDSPLAGLIVATVIVFAATLACATVMRFIDPEREIVVAEFEFNFSSGANCGANLDEFHPTVVGLNQLDAPLRFDFLRWI